MFGETRVGQAPQFPQEGDGDVSPVQKRWNGRKVHHVRRDAAVFDATFNPEQYISFATDYDSVKKDSVKEESQSNSSTYLTTNSRHETVAPQVEERAVKKEPNFSELSRSERVRYVIKILSKTFEAQPQIKKFLQLILGNADIETFECFEKNAEEIGYRINLTKPMKIKKGWWPLGSVKKSFYVKFRRENSDKINYLEFEKNAISLGRLLGSISAMRWIPQGLTVKMRGWTNPGSISGWIGWFKGLGVRFS